MIIHTKIQIKIPVFMICAFYNNNNGKQVCRPSLPIEEFERNTWKTHDTYDFSAEFSVFFHLTSVLDWNKVSNDTMSYPI